MKYWGFALLILCTLGFRIFPGGNLWLINKEDPALYLRFCEQMVPSENDVDSSDPLYGTTITQASLVDSIMNDYNSISGAYLILKDSARTLGFDSVVYQHRIIDICFSGQQDFIEGHAQPKYDDAFEHYNGCEIQIGRKTTDTAKRLLRVLTHEIGHCLALDHDFDTSHSIMSYFSTAYRLQSDDKAGIVQLYPMNTSDSKPQSTFGLSCSAK